MSNITKYDIVETIYKSSDYERQVVQFVVDSFLSEMKKNIEAGNKIELRGFGSFEAKLRNGRKDARNPKTGETFDVPPHYVASFKAGQHIKSALLELKVKND